MKLWRVSPVRSLADACHSRTAGRWSWASRDMLYTSSSPELATLEALAHRAEKPVAHWLCVIELPRVTQCPHIGALPEGWRSQPGLTRRLGNQWLDGQSSAVLLVPSVLCAEASNVLVNPMHPDARGMRMRTLRRFDFDRRLLRAC